MSPLAIMSKEELCKPGVRLTARIFHGKRMRFTGNGVKEIAPAGYEERRGTIVGLAAGTDYSGSDLVVQWDKGYVSGIRFAQVVEVGL